MRAGLCMKPGARACALGKALVIARTGKGKASPCLRGNLGQYCHAALNE